MKHLHFDVELNGFYGAYWACVGGSDCAVITMIGDGGMKMQIVKIGFGGRQ